MKAVLIFSSGKIVFTGAKTKEDIDKAFEILKERLLKYKSGVSIGLRDNQWLV